MKKRFIAAIAATAAISGLYAFGLTIQNTCVPGNAAYEAGTGICNSNNAATAKEEAAEVAAKAKADAKREAALAKMHAAEAKRKAEASKANAAAEAKFKAEGWFQLKPGIYGRWCTETCNNSKVIGRSTYWLMEVWAKDRSAGDIYARINITSNGTVVGWTNDTTYLSHGQKGILTFSTYQSGVNGAQLTEFNARG